MANLALNPPICRGLRIGFATSRPVAVTARGAPSGAPETGGRKATRHASLAVPIFVFGEDPTCDTQN